MLTITDTDGSIFEKVDAIQRIRNFPSPPEHAEEAAPGTATANARRVAVLLVSVLGGNPLVVAADGCITLLWRKDEREVIIYISRKGVAQITKPWRWEK